MSGGSGDVVIVVPSMDNLPEPSILRPDAHHICIDAEAEMEPPSPKTMTESSSEFATLQLLIHFMIFT